jgi:Uma2 family endonuclease
VTTEQYLYDTEETNRIRELALGMVREPPAPFFSHQSLVLKVARLLGDHVEPRGLGRVAVAPLDVVLDRERALIVQPDVLFVSTARLSIIRDQVWGVRECWLVDLSRELVTLVDFTGPFPVERVAKGVDSIRSSVLPAFETSAFGVFS